MTDPHPDPTADADEPTDRLGPALRAARGTESLREVQARTGISDSALSAYELGRRLPPREFLELLDAAYHQHGGLLAVARFDAWEPIGDPGTTHRWTIPATWTGPIWCTVRPAREPLKRALFRWGPWARRVEPTEPIASASDATFTMIVNRIDGESADHRVLTCETATPTWAFWATGGPPPELGATDISEGWYPHEDSAVSRLAGRLLLDALAHCGRTTAELADFLGVDVAVIDALGRGEPLGADPDGAPPI